MSIQVRLKSSERLLKVNWKRLKMNKKIEFWKEEFEFLEADDRLVYLIDMAKKSTSLPAEMRTPDRLIKGCMNVD